jgi:hypothetical protein
MRDPKSTKLNIRENRPTAISSRAGGSNLEAIGFNLNFLALRNPKLALEVLKLYSNAHDVKEDDPNAHGEDLELFTDALTKLMSEAPEDDK